MSNNVTPLPLTGGVSKQINTGAGVTGLVGFIGFLGLASVLFITENYFASLLFTSMALLFYVTGKSIGRIFFSSFAIFFSSRHLVTEAACLEDTLHFLKNELKLGTLDGHSQPGITAPASIRLPNNSLTRELQKLLREGRGFDSIEYAVHSYYIECHELYDFASANLDFVAVSMPIFGLIGTVLGLMSMFDNLGGDITVDTLSPQLAMALKTTLYGALFSAVYKILGSRFERRISTLDYDYGTFCRAIQVLIENKIQIELTL